MAAHHPVVPAPPKKMPPTWNSRWGVYCELEMRLELTTTCLQDRCATDCATPAPMPLRTAISSGPRRRGRLQLSGPVPRAAGTYQRMLQHLSVKHENHRPGAKTAGNKDTAAHRCHHPGLPRVFTVQAPPAAGPPPSRHDRRGCALGGSPGVFFHLGTLPVKRYYVAGGRGHRPDDCSWGDRR